MSKAGPVQLEIVAQVAAALLDVQPEDPEKGLERLLAVLVNELGSGSGSLYRLEHPGGGVERLARHGRFVAPESSYRLDLFPSLAARILAGEPTVFATAQMPDAAREAREALESIGIRHGLVLPMQVPGGLWGILAFWWGEGERVPEGPVDSLMTVASLVAQSMRWLDAEKERRTVNAWFRLYSEASSEMIGIHEAGVFVDANEPALRLLRARREDIIGRPILDFTHPDDRVRVMERVRSGAVGAVEVRALRVDGTVVWCQLKGRQTVVDGQPIRLIVARDITDLVRDREIRARTLQTRRLEGLGLLASGIAHDFNNLLVGMLGNAELAELDPVLGDNAREALGHIRDAALRAAGLTRQLLAYAGKGPRQSEPLDLSTQVGELLPLLHVTQREGVRLEVELHDSLPLIDIDSSQLDQVIMNLVTNAIDAVGELGTVRVTTRPSTVGGSELGDPGVGEVPAGGYVLLEVSDDGPGMDEPTRDRVFDPFFSTKTEGRGLGLAAVHGIVHRHGGRVDVHSRVGIGTVFRVCFLPAARRPVGLSEAESASSEPLSGSVLLVDDDAAVRRVARRLLEVSRFGVREVSSGVAALELIEGGVHFDAVLLDLSMPGLGGYEVYDRIRAVDEDLPVVICSGAADPRRFASDERVALLHKPYARADLVSVLGSLLGHRTDR